MQISIIINLGVTIIIGEFCSLRLKIKSNKAFRRIGIHTPGNTIKGSEPSYHNYDPLIGSFHNDIKYTLVRGAAVFLGRSVEVESISLRSGN